MSCHMIHSAADQVLLKFNTPQAELLWQTAVYSEKYIAAFLLINDS